MIKLTVDSRDKIFQNKFGAAFELPDELNLDTGLYDEVQPIGDVKCTCYTTCDIAEDTTKTEFSIDDLWARIPKNQFGANPRDVLKEAVENGLLPRGKSVRLKNWSSYYRADLGNSDPFDNLRGAIALANSPVGVCTYWHKEWQNAEVLPIGKTPLNGHMYACEGWKLINGEPYLIIEAWTGKKLYMSREVFNAAMKPYGMQAWVLSTSAIDAKREKNLIETIKDLMVNLIIKLRSLIVEKGVEPVVPAPLDSTEPRTYQESSQVLDKRNLSTYEVSSKFAWGTPEQARLSVRMICDEEKLTVEQKNTLCATVGAESGWKPRAVGKPNSNGSKDWGICQINDRLWIGKGKDFPSTDYVLDNPEACIRWMCKWWKAGKREWWIAYKNGSFAKYL